MNNKVPLIVSIVILSIIMFFTFSNTGQFIGTISGVTITSTSDYDGDGVPDIVECPALDANKLPEFTTFNQNPVQLTQSGQIYQSSNLQITGSAVTIPNNYVDFGNLLSMSPLSSINSDPREMVISARTGELIESSFYQPYPFDSTSNPAINNYPLRTDANYVPYSINFLPLSYCTPGKATFSEQDDGSTYKMCDEAERYYITITKFIDYNLKAELWYGHRDLTEFSQNRILSDGSPAIKISELSFDFTNMDTISQWDLIDLENNLFANIVYIREGDEDFIRMAGFLYSNHEYNQGWTISTLNGNARTLNGPPWYPENIEEYSGYSAQISDPINIDDFNPSPPMDDDLDSDGDGLPDKKEDEIGTDPYDPDSDDDGLTDGEEVDIHRTDPNNPDSDYDNLTDGWEIQNNQNPLDYSIPCEDADSNGIPNWLDNNEVPNNEEPEDPTNYYDICGFEGSPSSNVYEFYIGEYILNIPYSYEDSYELDFEVINVGSDAAVIAIFGEQEVIKLGVPETFRLPSTLFGPIRQYDTGTELKVTLYGVQDANNLADRTATLSFEFWDIDLNGDSSTLDFCTVQIKNEAVPVPNPPMENIDVKYCSFDDSRDDIFRYSTQRLVTGTSYAINHPSDNLHSDTIEVLGTYGTTEGVIPQKILLKIDGTEYTIETEETITTDSGDLTIRINRAFYSDNVQDRFAELTFTDPDGYELEKGLYTGETYDLEGIEVELVNVAPDRGYAKIRFNDEVIWLEEGILYKSLSSPQGDHVFELIGIDSTTRGDFVSGLIIGEGRESSNIDEFSDYIFQYPNSLVDNVPSFDSLCTISEVPTILPLPPGDFDPTPPETTGEFIWTSENYAALGGLCEISLEYTGTKNYGQGIAIMQLKKDNQILQYSYQGISINPFSSTNSRTYEFSINRAGAIPADTTCEVLIWEDFSGKPLIGEFSKYEFQ